MFQSHKYYVQLKSLYYITIFTYFLQHEIFAQIHQILT
jgi:hypothetical protein